MTDCWLIITSGPRFAKQWDSNPATQATPPYGATIVKLGPVGQSLSLDELAFRHANGIDFELRLRWKEKSLAPAGLEELT